MWALINPWIWAAVIHDRCPEHRSTILIHKMTRHDRTAHVFVLSFRSCAQEMRMDLCGPYYITFLFFPRSEETRCSSVGSDRFLCSYLSFTLKLLITAMTKVAVVTGSNKGIGLAIVRALCKQYEGEVYLTARDTGRGEEAVKTLNAEGLKPKFQQLDINDLNSITRAAAFFKDKYGGVDVLINNAAIAFKVADTTPFAVQAEVTLQTNFFATRDMLIHFMPLIKPGGRVVNVSSFVGVNTLKKCSEALQARFRSEDITEDELVGLMKRFVEKTKTGHHKEDGWPETAYGVSKTGLTTLSMILARRLSKERPHDNILLNACCPGWVRTDMAGDKAPKSPDEGAVTPVYLALLPPGAKEPHGCFVSEKKVQPW